MKTTKDINNTQDFLDSRDIIKRIKLLQDEIETAESDEQTAGTCDYERAELEILLKLQEETSDYAPDWEYGATLIRDSYFKDYAQQLCEDIGDVPHGLPNYIVIDWEATARNIQMDYTAVDFDGVTYWVR